MIDFIKLHKVFSFVTLMFFVVAFFIYAKWIEIENKRRDIQKKMISMEKNFQKLVLYEYKLTDVNYKTSRKNLESAISKYKEQKRFLINNYTLKFPNIDFHKVRPVDVKRNLTVWVKSKVDSLNESGVQIANNLTFDSFVRKESPPPKIGQVKFLYKHLFIIDQLIEIIKKAGITNVSVLKRNSGISFKDELAGKSASYSFALQGSIISLKKVINELSNSSKLFVLIKNQEFIVDVNLRATSKEGRVSFNEQIKEVQQPFRVKAMTLKLDFDVYDFGGLK